MGHSIEQLTSEALPKAQGQLKQLHFSIIPVFNPHLCSVISHVPTGLTLCKTVTDIGVDMCQHHPGLVILRAAGRVKSLL